MQFKFSETEQRLFDVISESGKALGYPVYVIGGHVRDKLLGIPSQDIDVVCQGSGIQLAEEVAYRLKPKPQLGKFGMRTTYRIVVSLLLLMELWLVGVR